MRRTSKNNTHAFCNEFYHVDEQGNFVAVAASDSGSGSDSGRGYTPNSHAVFDSVQVGDGRAWILADGAVHATEAAQLAKLDQLAAATR